MKLFLCVACLSLFFLLVFPSFCLATVRNVPDDYQTIQAAIDASQPGDTVRIGEGVYFETITISGKSGTKADPVVVEGAPGERVIIDGAYRPLTLVNNSLWKTEPSIGPGVYSTYFPFSSETEDWVYVSLADESLLWTYGTMKHFKQFFAGQGVFRDNENERLYIKLDNNTNPNTVSINASTATAVLYLPNSSHWRFRNLELKHGSRAVIFPRFTLEDLIFEDIIVKTARYGFLIWESYQGSVSQVIIRDSNFYLGWDDNWWWSDVKLKYDDIDGKSVHVTPMEGTGVRISGAKNSEIYNCQIEGFFNGISANGESTKVHNNTIHNLLDDAIESDSYSRTGGDLRIYNNFIYDAYIGLSLSPAPRGPVYVYRNTIIADHFNKMYKAGVKDHEEDYYEYGSVFKLGGELPDRPTENIKFYHNTCYAKGSVLKISSFDDYALNLEWYNNIFYSVELPVIHNTGLVSDGHFFDGNLYFRETEGALIKRWNSYDTTYFYSLDDARNSTLGQRAGWEINGIEANPLFVEIPNEGSLPINFYIADNSPAINSGVDIPLEKSWPDSIDIFDNQPDIGAYEYAKVITPTQLVSSPTSSAYQCKACDFDKLAKDKGNANCDNELNISDFAIWKREYLQYRQVNQFNNNYNSDFDCDQKISISDFAIWKTNYLSGR
ncbi:right-handed parallel beta-helix repeat-containing protein [Patescibacteria group bacterium]|nr:right-handed parallel beta-helix repeat-containing protein [Patescibacteria group bacterium]